MKDKLDEFAALAMQGYLINSDHFEAIFSKADDVPHAHRMIAAASYDVAEAMIAERERRKVSDP